MFVATSFLLFILASFSHVVAFPIPATKGGKSYHHLTIKTDNISLFREKQYRKVYGTTDNICLSSSLQDIQLLGTRQKTTNDLVLDDPCSMTCIHSVNEFPLGDSQYEPKQSLFLPQWRQFSFVVFVTLVTIFSFDGNAEASSTTTTTTAIEKGTLLFETNCIGCHRGGANYIKESKTLQKDALEQYYDLDPVKIQTFVQTKMPHKLLPFQQTFQSNDYSDVVSYVLDQAINNKW
jgi:cytochrome c6